eukprot:CAMPEP_0196730426 /NCGR_PEP_ID=MMETSP1091-20130531/10484_1 /TAXON_ID=302021 /ORGANISM="Rhodomonas sp., Strain CCMP768" /LENGTH=169 /DNA_ID=CAMNT_0042073421 /DNA_START=168 /DNA_END=677 /DNA_ORIENTATION=-
MLCSGYLQERAARVEGLLVQTAPRQPRLSRHSPGGSSLAKVAPSAADVDEVWRLVSGAEARNALGDAAEGGTRHARAVAALTSLPLHVHVPLNAVLRAAPGFPQLHRAVPRRQVAPSNLASSAPSPARCSVACCDVEHVGAEASVLAAHAGAIDVKQPTQRTALDVVTP